METHVDAVAR